MSNPVRPHRRPPTRLLCPWDSPGKNTGVGCHFLLQCMKVKSESEVAQLFLTLSDSMVCSLPGSSVHGIFQAIPWDFPGRTGLPVWRALPLPDPTRKWACFPQDPFPSPTGSEVPLNGRSWLALRVASRLKGACLRNA